MKEDKIPECTASRLLVKTFSWYITMKARRGHAGVVHQVFCTPCWPLQRKKRVQVGKRKVSDFQEGKINSAFHVVFSDCELKHGVYLKERTGKTTPTWEAPESELENFQFPSTHKARDTAVLEEKPHKNIPLCHDTSSEEKTFLLINKDMISAHTESPVNSDSY